MALQGKIEGAGLKSLSDQERTLYLQLLQRE
jgi:hypothetical protein